MSDRVTLLGAEQVQNAAHTMSDAANRMQSAASTMYSSTERLAQILDDHATRIERAVESLIDALKPEAAR